jgi:hypothetical protein
MATILPYLQDDAFQPDDITAMSMALDDVCKELKLDGNANAKETIAVRIIELARCGERSPTKLRDRVLREANDLTAYDRGRYLCATGGGHHGRRSDCD